MNKIPVILLFSTLNIVLFLNACHKDEPITPAPVTTIGATYAGGIVFYLSEDGQHGMVVSSINLDTCIWGEHGINIGCDAQEIGSGLANTQAICNTLGTGNYNYAAKSCLDFTGGGYNDWYLPSRNEFLEIFKSHVLGESDTNPNIGSYWTSTESGPINAYYGTLQSGGLYSISELNKEYVFRVRAVRRF